MGISFSKDKFMISESKSSALRHYLILLSIMVVGLWGIIWLSFDRGFQLLIVWAMAAAYLSWGIVHHWIHGDTNPRVILEYLLIAALGVITVSALISQ